MPNGERRINGNQSYFQNFFQKVLQFILHFVKTKIEVLQNLKRKLTIY